MKVQIAIPRFIQKLSFLLLAFVLSAFFIECNKNNPKSKTNSKNHSNQGGAQATTESTAGSSPASSSEDVEPDLEIPDPDQEADQDERGGGNKENKNPKIAVPCSDGVDSDSTTDSSDGATLSEILGPPRRRSDTYTVAHKESDRPESNSTLCRSNTYTVKRKEADSSKLDTDYKKMDYPTPNLPNQNSNNNGEINVSLDSESVDTLSNNNFNENLSNNKTTESNSPSHNTNNNQEEKKNGGYNKETANRFQRGVHKVKKKGFARSALEMLTRKKSKEKDSEQPPQTYQNCGQDYILVSCGGYKESCIQ
ncbi:MAG: hypothetical protein NMK33_03910 [Candidatus Cardinium sp.]|uniref:hypothetical protein n=1 Tax=Cardinium endosymbiont of Dermatophagoides farinae TaxID=2597823 RepID=UPI001183D1E3|nr:hypothetical protein [Cardinium endosymbiont of Dermatophagoides farinae]TSJ80589.1 hypothetical protein FPG78_00635 [Cardinium endosymbiont of Dermatophagoides farinae]UWW96577.1 MAG: hypothetical protein NMK33_03910 [Candidatus Cardinium sp.]